MLNELSWGGMVKRGTRYGTLGALPYGNVHAMQAARQGTVQSKTGGSSALDVAVKDRITQAYTQDPNLNTGANPDSGGLDVLNPNPGGLPQVKGQGSADTGVPQPTNTTKYLIIAGGVVVLGVAAYWLMARK